MTDQNGRIHNQVAELLSAYIDDEVSADERVTVEAHLAACATCVQDLASLRQTVTLLGALPHIAAPRPFTLRASDVRPVPGPDRPAWWRLRWVQGLAGAAAMVLCVAVVGLAVLGRGAMLGSPAAPQQMAMEAASGDLAANQEGVVEKAVEAETIVEAELEVSEAAEQPVEPPAAAAEETAEELGLSQAAPVEEKAAAQEAEMPMAAPPADRSGADEAAATSPIPSPMPTATPASRATTTAPPPVEALPAPEGTPTPTLLETEDLVLEIEPGVIRARGRLALAEGRKLLAVLWRDGAPIDWATLDSRRLVVEADGRFNLVLMAKAEIPNFDLFDSEPADYEIRIRPVDPLAPVEIRIPFDTYGPATAPPTNTP